MACIQAEVLGTREVCRSTAGGRACSWNTSDADGHAAGGRAAGVDGAVDADAVGDAGDIVGHKEGVVASDEVLLLLDHWPCLHQACHQVLPVYSAQPADGGYSSCRLGG